MDIYTTIQLQQALRSLHRTPRFLLDMFFPGAVNFDTKQISFDIENDNLELAPFVSPVVAGKADRASGHQTKTFTPAYVKPKTQVDPNAPLIRQPGEGIGGTLTAGQRRDLAINDILIKHREKIDRRKEWMAAQILRTGKVLVSGEQYPEAEVDFGRAGGHTKLLENAARWGEANVSPYTDLESWMDTVSEAVGAGVNLVVLGKTAWSLLLADPKFEKALDREKGQTNQIELGFQTGEPGSPQIKGSVGDVMFATYNGLYKDENGAVQKLIDPLGVLIGATGAAAGFQANGAILDGSSGYVAADYFPKNWVENDPPVEFVMTQAAPLPIIGRPNATLYAKVR